MGLPFVAPTPIPTTQATPTPGPSSHDDYIPRVVEGHHVHPLHKSTGERDGRDAWPAPHDYTQPPSYRRQWAGPSILNLPKGGVVIHLP